MGHRREIITRVVTPHVEGCAALRAWPDNPWAYFEDGQAVYLDRIGRKTHGIGRRFIRLRCNGYNCSARVLVRESDLTRLVQASLTSEAR